MRSAELLDRWADLFDFFEAAFKVHAFELSMKGCARA
jgi:hypothetical protein